MSAATPERPARDVQAEQDHAEFAGWFEAQAYDAYQEFDEADMSDAFAAGTRAEREAAAAHEGTPVYLAAIATLSAALRGVLDATMDGTPAHDIAHRALGEINHVRPAPQADLELAAALSERNQARDAALAVLDSFTRGSDGWRARLSGVTLMRAYRAIGAPVPDRLRHLEGQ